MTEKTARYISLIVISTETIFAFIMYIIFYFGMLISQLSVDDNVLQYEQFIFPLAFFIIGSFVILSSFFKMPFYIFSVLEVALTVYVFIISSFHPTPLILCAIILAPQLFYYIARIKIRNNS